MKGDVGLKKIYFETFPYFRIWSTLFRTVSTGIAKPIPELEPLVE